MHGRVVHVPCVTLPLFLAATAVLGQVRRAMDDCGGFLVREKSDVNPFCRVSQVLNVAQQGDLWQAALLTCAFQDESVCCESTAH